jgi:hypothetical protein
VFVRRRYTSRCSSPSLSQDVSCKSSRICLISHTETQNEFFTHVCQAYPEECGKQICSPRLCSLKRKKIIDLFHRSVFGTLFAICVSKCLSTHSNIESINAGSFHFFFKTQHININNLPAVLISYRAISSGI